MISLSSAKHSYSDLCRKSEITTNIMLQTYTIISIEVDQILCEETESSDEHVRVNSTILTTKTCFIWKGKLNWQLKPNVTMQQINLPDFLYSSLNVLWRKLFAYERNNRKWCNRQFTWNDMQQQRSYKPLMLKKWQVYLL